MRILIAGCGYVGSALARELVAESHTVYGLRRTKREVAPGVTSIAADMTDPEALAGLPSVDAIVYCASADGRTEEAYRSAYVEGLGNILARYADEPLSRVVFTSSTAVYGDEGGARVDEDTTPRPSSFTGETMLEAEDLLADALGPRGVSVRLAGIYGPTRTRLVSRIASGQAPGDPDRITNRIHRDDCAGAIAHLLTLAEPAPLYVGVDAEPAPMREVAAFIAEELGVDSPYALGENDAEGSSRRVGSKQCASDRLRASGYSLRIPTYREGYPAICREFAEQTDESGAR